MSSIDKSKADDAYKKKRVGTKTLIQCSNSKVTGPYYNGNICDEWVHVNDDSISAVCYKCVMEMMQQ